MSDKTNMTRVALVGRGISQSLTPAMHEAEGRFLGLDYQYKLIDQEAPAFKSSSLPEILTATQSAGFAGLNITHPFKVEVIQHLDCLSEVANRLHAVNTVLFKAGKRVGYNTDYTGFKASFQHSLGNSKKDCVLLLGAGGAGSAVAFALAESGVGQLLIHDTDKKRAESLVERVTAYGSSSGILEIGCPDQAVDLGLDGIVNATTAGMAGNPGSAFPLDLLNSETWVADIIYFPLETALLAKARAIGCLTLPGSGMAVRQAMHAFELFTGHAADHSRMQKTFLELVDPIQHAARKRSRYRTNANILMEGP